MKFTPSRLDPHGEFADEFYYPPDVEQQQRIAAVAAAAAASDERRKPSRFDDLDDSFYDKLGEIGKTEESEYIYIYMYIYTRVQRQVSAQARFV